MYIGIQTQHIMERTWNGHGSGPGGTVEEASSRLAWPGLASDISEEAEVESGYIPRRWRRKARKEIKMVVSAYWNWAAAM
jgi:hypothetical protein